jgi:hypothetical protein
VAETARGNNAPFVIIETRGHADARTVHELVVAIEPHVELVASYDSAKSQSALTKLLPARQSSLQAT